MNDIKLLYLERGDMSCVEALFVADENCLVWAEHLEYIVIHTSVSGLYIPLFSSVFCVQFI